MKVFTFLLALALPLIGNAASECYPTGCSSVLVDMLYVQANGDILVGTEGDESKLNCGTAESGYSSLNSGDDNFGILYSTLLAARMAAQPIRIRIHEGNSSCKISYVVVED